MGSLTLLLGRTRERRRRALRAEQFAGIDVLGRPNFLFVTDSARKKITVQEEFVQYRNGASFLPEVATLAELQAHLANRYVGGKATWSEAGVGLWLIHHFSTMAPPWLQEAGPPERVAPSVASAFFTWDSACRPNLPGGRGARLVSLFRRMAAALDASPSAACRHTSMRELIRGLESPGEALTVWLRRSSLVVVDDVIDPAPLDREVLLALSRAWSAAGANVVLSFECGMDGVEEEARYFGLEDGEGRLSPTLSATSRLRRACLDALIADGSAYVFVAGPEFAASSGPPPEEVPDPTDVWGTAGEAEAPGLALESWPDPAGEVQAIAHAVRALLDGGERAADIQIAFPALPRYAGLVRRTFAEVGIPHAISRGEAVGSLPGARALMGALRAMARPDEPADLLAALLPVDLPSLPAPAVAAMARRLREKGVRRAGPEAWVPLAAANDPAGVTALQAEIERLSAVLAAPGPEAWEAALGALARGWGLREGTPERDVAARRGAGHVLRAAANLVAEARTAREEPSGSVLTALWLAALEGASAPPRTALQGGVAVVGMLELRGIHPKHLFIGGLLADDFPGSAANDWLFDSRGRDAVGLAVAMPQARYLLGSAIRNAVAQSGGTLTLSWPRQIAGKLVLPSPVVEELLSVQVRGAPLRARVAARRVPDGRFGEAAWMRAAARQSHAPWRALLRGDLERRSASERERAGREFGAWSGVTGLPHDGAPLAVTAFENYLACPARYLYSSVLALRQEESFSLDLPASARGRLLHRVLQRFFRTAMIEGIATLQTGDATTSARHLALLTQAATAELAADRDVAALPEVQRRLLEEEWCDGLADERPAGLLRAWLDAERAAPPSQVRAVELDLEMAVGPLRLRGRADRVDNLGADAQLVLDHKTGGLPTRQVAAGFRVQGVLYARAVATAERPRVAGGFASVRAPDDVGRGAWAGPASLLSELSSRGGLPTDGEAGAGLSDWLEASAARLAAGRFHPTTADPDLAGCGYCAFATICRVDHARSPERRQAADGTVQVPFGTPPAEAEEAE